MSDITISDLTASADLQISDSSLPKVALLQRLKSTLPDLVKAMNEPVDRVPFKTAMLGAVFAAPSFALDAAHRLLFTTGVTCTLQRYTAADSPLLGNDPTFPKVQIGAGTTWLSFTLNASVSVSVSGATGGFGVAIKDSSALALTHYQPFTPPPATLQQAIEQTLNELKPVLTAQGLRAQNVGSVLVQDVQGSLSFCGSFSFPTAVNQLAMAESHYPFPFSLQPEASVSVAGKVTLSGDFSIRSYRETIDSVTLAAFKKRASAFTATFEAGVGIDADLAGADIVSPFFGAIAPGLDLEKSGLSAKDPRVVEIAKLLTDSISHAFEISANATCTASYSDETAFVYTLDLSTGQEATDSALNQALAGDWTMLKKLPNAHELRNIVHSAADKKVSLAINLLGVFNYETVEEFARSSTILRDPENATITITDSVTAKQIMSASTPWLSDTKRLRAALYAATVATAVYSTAGGPVSSTFTVKQQLLIYKAAMPSQAIRKNLLLAVVLGRWTQSDWASLKISSPKPANVLIQAQQSFTGDAIRRLFFSNVAARVPHEFDDLVNIGRRTMAAILDPANPTDAARIATLNNDAQWKAYKDTPPPEALGGAYSDWFDITNWAEAVVHAAKPLRAVLVALDALRPGVDPASDPNLNAMRKALTNALASIAKASHAAFEEGWPIAALAALAQDSAEVTMTARWDGVEYIVAAGAAQVRTATS